MNCSDHSNRSSTGISANFSLDFQLPELMHAASYCGLTLAVLASLINFTILATFLCHPRRLITPFSIHVVNLTFINLLNAAVYQPLMMASNLDRRLVRGAPAYCSALKYLQWTTVGMTALQQCVICMDRWLALLAPLWYRSKSTAFGVQATLLALLYQQAWYLPLFITDVVTQVPVEPWQICASTTALPAYQLVARVAGLYVPQVVLTASYPCLLYKVLRRRTHLLVGLGSSSVVPAIVVSDCQHGTHEVLRRRPSSGQTNSELHLVLWLVVLQMAAWTPTTVATVLFSVRSRLPHVLEVLNVSLIGSILVMVAEASRSLVFLRNLRRQVWRTVRCAFRLRVTTTTTTTKMGGGVVSASHCHSQSQADFSLAAADGRRRSSIASDETARGHGSSVFVFGSHGSSSSRAIFPPAG